MTGYKKCIYFDKNNYRFTECIVELEIPDDAKIVRPIMMDIWRTRNSSKLRCNKAIVKAIFSYDVFGNFYRLPDDTVAYSIASLNYCVNQLCFVNRFRTEYLIESLKSSFKYVVGETVTPEYNFDNSVYRECGSGIHFFEKIEEATTYSGLYTSIFNIKDTFKYLGIILNE